MYSIRQEGPGAVREVKQSLKEEKGLTLIEVVIALAIVGLTIMVLLQILPVAIVGTSRARAGVNVANLAGSQMESIKQQTFWAAYSPVSPIPDGFTIAITTSVPVTYGYPSPSFAQTTDTVQLVTVTVTGPYGSRSLGGYKARR